MPVEKCVFVPPHIDDKTFGVHRPITIEARLYLSGEYQTLVKEKAIIQGGPDDPDLRRGVLIFRSARTVTS